VSSLKRLMLAIPLAIGCAAAPTPKPLTYLASERPQGPIRRKTFPATGLSFSRGGLYFFNFGFRPAADVRSYVKNSETKTGSPLLTDADVRLQTPFAIDLLLFGYNSADDRVLLSEPEVVAK
jgi:hypothetical protein